MKKILTFILLLLTFGALAQKKPHRGEMHLAHEDLSPEQRASLQSKKMVLALDLDAGQQKQVESLLKDRFATRAKMNDAHRETARDSSRRLSPEERYALMNTRLEQEIAFQQEMKNILNESQFDQWIKRRRGKKQGHQKWGKEDRQGKSIHRILER